MNELSMSYECLFCHSRVGGNPVFSVPGVHTFTFWQKVTKAYQTFHVSFCYLFPTLFPKLQKLASYLAQTVCNFTEIFADR